MGVPVRFMHRTERRGRVGRSISSPNCKGDVKTTSHRELKVTYSYFWKGKDVLILSMQLALKVHDSPYLIN